ncbi:GntR family transcriptional regulator [uncultured Brevibacillus sp.]|uniref:GntR family transcriptional regulator n=1 Tax=uncultured Brevibacillus sp. TaxID=169970 RepID=UPI0025920008|nr:GntR family transcriptional regulator [uncultured Brevibacillus sp.]
MIAEMEIIDQFIAEINAGKYKPNDKLPSENDLADLYKVPRMKVRRAYTRLQELGYVFSKQGMGSYVKDRRQQIPLVLSGNESFSRKMLDMGYDYQSKNIFCEEIEYCQKIFQALGVDESDRVFKIGRLRVVDQRAIALHTSYVAQSVFNDIEQAGNTITSMFDYYHGKGYSEFESGQTILSVIVPTRYERELLECSGLIPLLVLESGCKDKKTGTVLEYTEIRYRSDSFTYLI